MLLHSSHGAANNSEQGVRLHLGTSHTGRIQLEKIDKHSAHQAVPQIATQIMTNAHNPEMRMEDKAGALNPGKLRS